MNTLSLLLLSSLVACGVDGENFAQSFAEISCEQGIACEEPGFDDYSDADACLPDAVADWQAVSDMGEEFNCPLDYDFAADCLKVFRDADCDAIADRSWETEGACADMFGCL